MAHEFEASDLVQLRSGGPKMTVELVTEKDGNVMVHCSWFEKNTLHEKDFNEKLLMKYQPPEPPALGSITSRRA